MFTTNLRHRLLFLDSLTSKQAENQPVHISPGDADCFSKSSASSSTTTAPANLQHLPLQIQLRGEEESWQRKCISWGWRFLVWQRVPTFGNYVRGFGVPRVHLHERAEPFCLLFSRMLRWLFSLCLRNSQEDEWSGFYSKAFQELLFQELGGYVSVSLLYWPRKWYDSAACQIFSGISQIRLLFYKDLMAKTQQRSRI